MKRKKNKTPQPVVFCRTMFCQHCFDTKSPQKGTKFLTYGNVHQELTLHKASQNGHFGYTPHIITLDEVLPDGRFKLFVSCGVIDCGWVLMQKGDDLIPDCLTATTVILEALEYSALKKNKDESYYLD